MKNFLWYILVLLSFLNSSAQQANLNDNFALKLSETRNVDEHFIMSEDKFGVFHLDSIKKYSRVYINLERYDEALVYTNVLSNFYIYKTLQHKEAFKTLNNFEKHLTNVTIPSEIGKYYVAYSEAAGYLEQLQNAVLLSKQGITYLEKVKDSSLYEYGYLYLKSAENLSKLNKISESAEHFEKASALFIHQKDTLFYLWSQNGLATLFGRNGLNDQAKKARQVIYEQGPKIGEEQVVAMAHLQAGVEAVFLDDHEELYHYREALKFKNEKSDIQEIVSVLVLSYASEAYARANKIDTAKVYLSRLNKIMEGKSFNSQLKTNYDFAKAYIALSENRLQDAERIGLELVKHIQNSKDAGLSLKINSLLSIIYERKGNNAKALEYYKVYSKVNDSIKTASTRNRFAYVQTQFETAKKDLEIETQKQNIELLDSENKVKSQWIIFGGLGLLGAFCLVVIIRSRNFAKKEKQQQEQYSQELIEAGEAERTRVARELHDSVGQKLMLLTRQTKTFGDTPMLTLANTTLEELRSISRGLHPSILNRLGLTSAITSLVNETDANTDIFFTNDIENIDHKISEDQALHIYRIIQEALGNIVKHSKSPSASVKVFNKDKTIVVLIKDNGIGFSTANKLLTSNSLGMKTLFERAKIIKGILTINSEPQKGTTISLTIPVK